MGARHLTAALAALGLIACSQDIAVESDTGVDLNNVTSVDDLLEQRNRSLERGSENVQAIKAMRRDRPPFLDYGYADDATMHLTAFLALDNAQSAEWFNTVANPLYDKYVETGNVYFNFELLGPEDDVYTQVMHGLIHCSGPSKQWRLLEQQFADFDERPDTNDSAAVRAHILDFAEGIGFTEDDMRACRVAPHINARLGASRRMAESVRMTELPRFFINSAPVDAFTLAEFDAVMADDVAYALPGEDD